MTVMDGTADVVVVGGGIAGGALAGRLAASGVDVLVLERQERYRDRVRGECLMPWGVAEARRLGVEQVLLDAGGGYATQSLPFDETIDPAVAEQIGLPLGRFVDGVPGFLDVGHPQASEALAVRAVAAGAQVLRGVGEVEVTVGAAPVVRFQHEGTPREVTCRLVVGADGRESRVRKDAGIALQESSPRSILTGLLVEGLDEWPADWATLGTEGDVHYLVFPRPGGIARLYIAHSMAQKDRFTGPERVRRFLDAFRVDSLPLGGAIADATPAGPCAGHPDNDAWTDGPMVEGAILVGDAAGWSNQLIGQGLSIALRDARTVADVLLASDDWSRAQFDAYATERAERMRRIRVVAELMTDVRCDFTPAGRARRLAFLSGIVADPLSMALIASMLSGPDSVGPEAFESENVDRVLAMA
jgi:2-polyprenyl-6-methoxyphenol hydroxylase-like FAD-dependent oxidoreductase